MNVIDEVQVNDYRQQCILRMPKITLGAKMIRASEAIGHSGMSPEYFQATAS